MEKTRLELIGERIKYLRKKANLTQKELAEKTHIQRKYLCKIENYKAPRVSYEQIKRIAKTLSVSMSVIVGDMDNEFRNLIALLRLTDYLRSLNGR